MIIYRNVYLEDLGMLYHSPLNAAMSSSGYQFRRLVDTPLRQDGGYGAFRAFEVSRGSIYIVWRIRYHSLRVHTVLRDIIHWNPSMDSVRADAVEIDGRRFELRLSRSSTIKMTDVILEYFREHLKSFLDTHALGFRAGLPVPVSISD